jgi:antitoxin HicB
MLAYPISFEEDENSILVTSQDFPELTTFGEGRDEAQYRALDALEEAIAARIHDRRDIPLPSQGGDAQITLPTLTAVKVILYQGMRDQGITKTGLARRLGWHLPQVDRVLDINHHSRLDQMDTALQAIGCRLSVSGVSSTPEVART